MAFEAVAGEQGGYVPVKELFSGGLFFLRCKCRAGLCPRSRLEVPLNLCRGQGTVVYRHQVVGAQPRASTRELISQRQDPKSGLFTLPPERPYTMRHNQRTKEPWEGLTSGDLLRKEFDYDRPKVVSLDVIDALALLAVYACRTGQPEKTPQWLKGGGWGTGTGCGHTINQDLERWFDREKLEKQYKDRQGWLKERGYEIGKGWYPE